jgi:DDE family transposase
MQFTRWLRNSSVTVTEMAQFAAEKTARRVAGRDVVAIQDTTELVLGGRKARQNGFGPVGKGGNLGGLLLHPTLAVDATTRALIGLVDLKIWNRAGKPAQSRRSRPTAEKESQRWVDGAVRAGQVLAAAAQITVISDQEGDIYEQFASRPANVHLIVRACQNRRIGTQNEAQDRELLFPFVDSQPEQGRLTVNIPPAPGRKARTAELAVRFASVEVRKPLHGLASGLPKTIRLTLVDVHEIAAPDGIEPVHWRLLTTHAVASLGDARRIVDFYRMRWIIEEFFRTLKTAGFNIEDADIGDPSAMSNFAAAATVAALTVMQLVRARDGTTDQTITDAFDPMDEQILQALSRELEGKTARQKNPHPQRSLAYAAWVIARLGGWTGYYGKPGPQVMRRGLEDFQRIKYGTTLDIHNV